MGQAFAAGAANLAQVRVLVDALDALPTDLGNDLVAKAETYLVEQAQVFAPRELRVLGRGVLEHLAPEIADEVEYQRLVAEDRRARAETRLSFKPRGDGSTDLHARLPDHVANRLRTYLEAFTSPRRTPLGEVDVLPTARRRGEAFCALLENLPDTGLPAHGGSATSVMVMLDLDTLITSLGTATTSTGDPSRQTRRDASPARPGSSPSSSVAKARSSTSAAQPGSSHPPNARQWPSATASAPPTAAWCPPPGARHITPRTPGAAAAGPIWPPASSSAPSHHHRAHDPGWIVSHRPNGSTKFHRRT